MGNERIEGILGKGQNTQCPQTCVQHKAKQKNLLASKPKMKGQKQHENVYLVLSKPL